MKIYFVETEAPGNAVYREAFPQDDVQFVDRLEEVGADAEIVSVFINEPVGPDFLAAHPKLQLLQTRSGGTDHIDIGAFRTAGVKVSYVPGYGDTTVAEHTFALMLALARRLREVMALPDKNHRFSYHAARGFELHGKTLGIVGMGRVGRTVAKLAQGFGMRVVAYDPLGRPHLPPTEAEPFCDWLSLPELLNQAHVISLHVRLSPWTHHLLNAETFAQCRPGVLIINTARGRLIHTQALQEALDSGQVGGAGLDVLEHEEVLRQAPAHIISAQIVSNLRSNEGHQEQPADRLRYFQEIVSSGELLKRPNVVFTPHVAFNSVEAVARLKAITIDTLQAFQRGEHLHEAEPGQ